MPNGDATEVWIQLNEFRREYERRHGELVERVAKNEIVVLNQATRADFVGMKGDIEAFRASVKTQASLADQLATKAELGKVLEAIDWLKWYTRGLAAAEITLILGIILHYLGKI